MTIHYWLVKQEPHSYSWSDFVADGGSAWTGIRNFQARNFLRQMKAKDRVLFYHSGDAKQVVGLAQVVRAAYADPTAAEGDWSAVDLAPVKPLPKSVTLQVLKADAHLKDLLLFRQSRLSVIPLTEAQFKRIIELASGRPTAP